MSLSKVNITDHKYWFWFQVTVFWRWRQHGPPKHWYPTTSLHGITI